jgi:glycosyltransferase involved in cell wall biosynthesis
VNTFPLLSPLTGVGNYIHYLIHYFKLLQPQNRYTYYYGLFGKKAVSGNQETYQIKRFIKHVPFLPDGLRRSMDFLSRFHRGQYDLYFEPNFIPLNIKARRTVTTIHDFSFHRHPEWHPKDRIKSFSRTFYKNIVRSARIITDSSYIKDEAVSILNLPDYMITSIPLGVEHETFKVHDKEVLRKYRDRMGLPEHFIFYAGNVEPRKNLKRLLHAYLELPEYLRKEYKLVLAGFKGWKNGEVAKIVRTLSEDVIRLGYVETQKLSYLYSLASLFVYPSLYEGFGLPPLEAMACGCPAIVSRTASLPEVCGDATHYVDPQDVHSIAEGMYRVLTDSNLQHVLSQRGLERAKSYRWEKTAEETLQVFNEVHGN